MAASVGTKSVSAFNDSALSAAPPLPSTAVAASGGSSRAASVDPPALPVLGGPESYAYPKNARVIIDLFPERYLE